MRLKPEKVESLSRQIVRELQADKTVTLQGKPDELEREIRRVILADLQVEDELLEEVERIIEKNRRKIAFRNVDMQVLRRKILHQLARERKFIL